MKKLHSSTRLHFDCRLDHHGEGKSATWGTLRLSCSRALSGARAGSSDRASASQSPTPCLSPLSLEPVLTKPRTRPPISSTHSHTHTFAPCENPVAHGITSSQHRTRPRSSQSHHSHLASHTLRSKMSTAARRRLMRDFKRMQTDPPAGVSASPIADNVMTWYGTHCKHPLRFSLKTNLRP